ncbi:hypothetical protein MMC34_006007 [Xylographa carneopallida]|nr:hypothetical protein [Xylographa carneopallida]
MNGDDGQLKSRVLVPEKLSPDGLVLLRKSQDVDEKKGLSAEDILALIPDYDALIVRSETKVTASLLQAGKKLKVVARAGVGVDNVDIEAATRLGIIVVNSPSGNISAAAEHTIALLLAVARNIADACSSLKDGKWDRSRLVGVEVKGKTLGIIGLGKVGITVARFAKGLGMTVEALDPYCSPAIAQSTNVNLVSSLPELLAISDFLTIHTPLIASTKGMIGKKELLAMKKGARILNVARGGMIDENALLDALNSGHIAGAGMDVFTSEPPVAGSSAARLIAHPKVVATPHLGASTVEAQENVSLDVCEQVLSILHGDLPRSAVNAPLILPEEYKTLQPFVRLVEKMGSLYTQHYATPHLSHAATSTSTAPQADARTTFDLVYEGALATLTNTKPLFAALIKGLTAPISPGRTVNLVNAELIARDRGLVVNEQHSRSPPDHPYSSLVTLRARPAGPLRASSSSRQRPDTEAPALRPTAEQAISGYVSASQIYISRLDRFATAFVPEGNLLVCHNYDSPGKIGVVGGILGREGVNINYMSVAPVSQAGEGSNEALMILGVDREVGREVVEKLVAEEGILEVSVLAL